MDDLRGASLVGRTLAHYRISTVIGAGGMGEVYRAADTKLWRDVAIKVLPQEMASDPDRLARFQREARAVAALNHPNIVTVYSVEECENVHFITMELIEGQPLERLIPGSGLAADRIIEIGGAIAEALASAHEKGIVHRDLKPANVMVTNEGRVKVLDFGLAKDVGADSGNEVTLTSTGRTQAGVVMGTPAYMSPEQVSGRPLDHRSDIFSFGVVLHEMATGRRPFAGSSSAELISSILRDTPPLVTDTRPELPSDLARVIRRCLEKDPRYRVQTARDVSNEFRDMARTPTRPTPLSIPTVRHITTPSSGSAGADEGFWVAVLPFKYSGVNADLAALAGGLTEEIITGLSRFSYLRVIARGSTGKYTDEFGDVRAIGKELGARYLMEGSLRQAGSKLRVAVQLLDTVSGAHLWAETYERTFTAESVFQVQDDLTPCIVATVADQCGVLPRSMGEVLRSKREDALTPHEAVLRAFSYFAHLTPEEHAAVRRILERAVREAPEHADSWAMLSTMYRGEFAQGFNAGPNPLDRALGAAQRAVDLAPTHALGHCALATAHFFRKETVSFRVSAERALALNPLDGSARAYLGHLMASSGEWDRGCQMIESAMRLNPNYPGWFHIALFANAYRQGKYREALEAVARMSEPGYFHTHSLRAMALGQLGWREEARKAVQDLLALRPDFCAVVRQEYAKWYEPELIEHFVEGLRKAGLEIPEAEAPAVPELSASASGSPKRTERRANRADEGFWVAVLPFKYGSNADLMALAEGLTDDIVTNMSKFSYLRVIARSSTAQYALRTVDVRTAAKELGARYVMEGSIRQAGGKVRIAVQLVDASSGASLWAETYDRSFAPETMLDLLDDVVPRIVATVGDAQGILAHSMTEALRGRHPASLTSYEALLRSFGFHQHVSADEHLAGVTALEQAVKRAPDHADCWAMLSWLYRAEYTHGYNPRPDSMDRSLAAARRAVNLAPSSQLAHAALASAHFFRGEVSEFRSEAERALARNRMEGYTTAFLGLHFAYSGDWERGCALCEGATQLNPNHPGWYWLPLAMNAYRNHDGQRALEYSRKVNMPGLWTAQVALAVVNSQLDQMEQARITVRELLILRPDFAAIAREELAKWWQPDMVEQMLGDLRKAGLPVQESSAARVRSTDKTPVRVPSGETRTDEGFWVAVLPFKYMGNNQDLKALAEGLTEEVITGLSRFSYLRVIARGSPAKYSRDSGDVRAIGKELGARYVMEGTLRQAGAKLRLAVQLVDASSGAHLWAETYERPFQPEALFDLQDEIVPRIVSTAADQDGTLPLSMAEALRNKSDDGLTPHEAMARSFGFFKRFTPEEHAKVRQILETAVRKSPDHGDCWAMLSHLYCNEHWSGFNARPDPLGRGLDAARRAVDLAPSNHLSYWALALPLFFKRELQESRVAAERCIGLNRMDGSTVAFMGALIAYSGDWERGCAIAELASALNPNHAGWHRVLPFYNAYRKGEYREALAAALRLNAPGSSSFVAARAAAYGQLGESDAAQKAVKELLAVDPAFAATARDFYARFLPAELVERLMDGLRKAGLGVPGESLSGNTGLAQKSR